MGDKMGRIQVGEHIWLKVSRRSLCDDCSAELCAYNHGERVESCDHFTPSLMAFKRCEGCEAVYEVHENFHSLNYDLCPRCNKERENVFVH
jgi:hypothetical protein